MFAITNVRVLLPKLGNVYPKIDSSAVSIEPYPSYDLYVADSLFLCLALWIGVQEGKDAFAAIRLGCSEFKDYLAFWNVVDWCNILLCVLTGVAWMDTINYMIDDTYNTYLNTDYKVSKNIMGLDSSTMDGITSKLQALRLRYWMMQITMAANTVFVVMKFFKSFQSNARLSVVSKTFQQAGVELAHFVIMFSTIFLPFVIIGHILFGSDIEDFASVTASINTGMICLFGDFGWYVEFYPKKFTDILPSGMPKFVLMIWYVGFMFLVFLVLLNMLLAVILEHYTQVSGDVQFEADAPAVWNQAIRWWRFRKRTKGFISLEVLRGDLENDEEPAHKWEDDPETNNGESVNVSSLTKAWKNMTQDQAAWLMELLDHNVDQGQKAAEKREKANRTNHLAEENKEKLGSLADSILDNKRRLDQLEGVQGGESDMTSGLEKLANLVTDLNVSVAKVRKEHDRLAVKVDDMVQAIPEGHRLELVQGAAQENASSSSGKMVREWKKGTVTNKPSSRDGGKDEKGKDDAKPSSSRSAASKWRSDDKNGSSSRDKEKSSSRDKTRTDKKDNKSDEVQKL